MENVPPLDAVTFSLPRYNLWVACRLQSIGDILKAETERNRLFREEVRQSLAQLQAEVERLSNASAPAVNNNNNYGASTNSNHGDDPRFDVSARISDMLGSTSASITEALLESDSQPASLLAPYGLIPPARIPMPGCLGVQIPRQSSPSASPSLNQTRATTTSSVNSPVVVQPKQEVDNFNEIDGEEEEDDEEDEDPGIKEEEGSMDSNEFVVSMANPSADGSWQSSDKEGLIVVKKKKKLSRKTATATTPRTIKNNYVETEWKKRRAREMASARMRRFRERQKLKKGLLQPVSQ